MTKLISVALSGAALVVLPFAAYTPAMADEPIVVQGANKYAEKDALKVVCKRSLKTGTRMKSQKCETKQQWTKEEEYAKREGKEILNSLKIETRRE